MKVTWSPDAKRQLRNVANYISREFGIARRDKFMEEVIMVDTLLRTHPHLGKIEPLLLGHPIAYRSYVVNRLNKMVYYIKDEQEIMVVAFWDVRREPHSNALGATP